LKVTAPDGAGLDPLTATVKDTLAPALDGFVLEAKATVVIG
jgi:hypothetical protein